MGFGRKLKRRTAVATEIADSDLRMYEVGTDATIEELEQSVRGLGPEVVRTQKPFFVVVRGYDDDPRELNVIPEVAELMQRLIDSGFIGLLGDNADLGAGNSNPLIDAKMCFLLSKGLVVRAPEGNVLQFTPAILEEFEKTLRVANEKVNLLSTTTRAT
jgi:hypothetical protein